MGFTGATGGAFTDTQFRELVSPKQGFLTYSTVVLWAEPLHRYWTIVHVVRKEIVSSIRPTVSIIQRRSVRKKTQLTTDIVSFFFFLGNTTVID